MARVASYTQRGLSWYACLSSCVIMRKVFNLLDSQSSHL